MKLTLVYHGAWHLVSSLWINVLAIFIYVFNIIINVPETEGKQGNSSVHIHFQEIILFP